MKIFDSVYGEFEVKEPVLVELINSKPLQRIKGVNQAGTQLVQIEKTTTRYDHCTGVMILLAKFGASLEEQIAGLLHDVPHTAFSHAADFVFKENESQTYHERFLKQIVFDSEIPAILEKYGFDPERVTDEHNFTLLEQDIPQLCADRIDYSLRDIATDKIFSENDIKHILDSITVFEGKFAMNDKKIGYFYAKAFMNQCLNSWNAPVTLTAFELFGQLVRQAIKIKVLTEQDLFQTDDEVLEKLKTSENKEVKNLLSKLNPNLSVVHDEINFDFDTRGKVRYIDPPILKNKIVTPLSKLNPAFERDIVTFIQLAKAGHKIRVIS